MDTTVVVLKVLTEKFIKAYESIKDKHVDLYDKSLYRYIPIHKGKVSSKGIKVTRLKDKPFARVRIGNHRFVIVDSCKDFATNYYDYLHERIFRNNDSLIDLTELRRLFNHELNQVGLLRSTYFDDLLESKTEKLYMRLYDSYTEIISEPSGMIRLYFVYPQDAAYDIEEEILGTLANVVSKGNNYDKILQLAKKFDHYEGGENYPAEWLTKHYNILKGDLDKKFKKSKTSLTFAYPVTKFNTVYTGKKRTKATDKLVNDIWETGTYKHVRVEYAVLGKNVKLTDKILADDTNYVQVIAGLDDTATPYTNYGELLVYNILIVPVEMYKSKVTFRKALIAVRDHIPTIGYLKPRDGSRMIEYHNKLIYMCNRLI